MKFRKHRSMAKKVAPKAAVLQKEISTIVKRLNKDEPEEKRTDVTWTNTANWNGLFYNHTGDCAQGTTDTTRVGDKIRLNYIHFRGYVKGNSSATAAQAGGTSQQLRHIVFSAKGNNIPVTTQIIDLATGSNQTVNGLLNWDFYKDYKVLHDHVYNVPCGWLVQPTTSGGVSLPETYTRLFNFKVKIPHNNSLVNYLVASTNATNNQLYSLLLSDTDSGGGNNGPAMVAHTRMAYTDS